MLQLCEILRNSKMSAFFFSKFVRKEILKIIKNIIVVFFKIFKILYICSNVTLYLYLFILLSIYSLYNYLPIIIIFEKTNTWQHSFQHFINFQKSFRNKRNLKNNIQKHNCNFDSHSLLLSSKILFILPPFF